VLEFKNDSEAAKQIANSAPSVSSFSNLSTLLLKADDLFAYNKSGRKVVLIMLGLEIDDASSSPNVAAGKLKTNGAEIYIVANSNNVDPRSIEGLASTPASDYVLWTNDFQNYETQTALLQKLLKLNHYTCHIASNSRFVTFGGASGNVSETGAFYLYKSDLNAYSIQGILQS
jgi:hypothetical protein